MSPRNTNADAPRARASRNAHGSTCAESSRESPPTISRTTPVGGGCSTGGTVAPWHATTAIATKRTAHPTVIHEAHVPPRKDPVHHRREPRHRPRDRAARRARRREYRDRGEDRRARSAAAGHDLHGRHGDRGGRRQGAADRDRH